MGRTDWFQEKDKVQKLKSRLFSIITTQLKSYRERGEQNFPDIVLSLCLDIASVRIIKKSLKALCHIFFSIQSFYTYNV